MSHVDLIKRVFGKDLTMPEWFDNDVDLGHFIAPAYLCL